MMVCIKSFRANYAGRDEVLTAGVSHATNDHELVKRFPGHWAPAFAKSNASRDRVYASGLDNEIMASIPSDGAAGAEARILRAAAAARAARPTTKKAGSKSRRKRPVKQEAPLKPVATKPDPVKPRVPTANDIKVLWDRRGGPKREVVKPSGPIVRSFLDTKTSSPFVIRLGLQARRDLLDELKVGRDGLEIGVALYGERTKGWANEIQISRIGTAGRNSVREQSAFKRDHIHEARQAERLRALANSSSLVELAYAHSHPGSDPLPSVTDLSHFTKRRVALGLTSYAAVIATPSRDRGWDLNCWVMRELGPGRDVCEAAQIIT